MIVSCFGGNAAAGSDSGPLDPPARVAWTKVWSQPLSGAMHALSLLLCAWLEMPSDDEEARLHTLLTA